MNFETHLHPEAYKHRRKTALRATRASYIGGTKNTEKIKKRGKFAEEHEVYDKRTKHKDNQRRVYKENDLTRIKQHEQDSEDNRQTIENMSSRLIDSIFLQKSGLTWQELKKIKKEDKDFLMDYYTSKDKNAESDVQLLLSNLGWRPKQAIMLTQADREYIFNKRLNKSRYDSKAEKMHKELGYSLNQIFEIIPDEDKEMIVKNNINNKDYIKILRLKNMEQFRAKKGGGSLGKKSFTAWLSSGVENPSGGKQSLPIREGNTVDDITLINRLGWKVQEAKNMSKEKASFILDNNIKKLDWHLWEPQFKEMVNSGSYIEVDKLDKQKERTYLIEKIQEAERLGLIKAADILRGKLEELEGGDTNVKVKENTPAPADTEKIDQIASKIIHGAISGADNPPVLLSQEEQDFYNQNRETVNKRVAEIQRQNIEIGESKTPPEKRKALQDLGFSDNQIDWVLNSKDKKIILKFGLSPEDWLKKKREFYAKTFQGKELDGGIEPTQTEDVNEKVEQVSKGDRPSIDVQVPEGVGVDVNIGDNLSEVRVDLSGISGAKEGGNTKNINSSTESGFAVEGGELPSKNSENPPIDGGLTGTPIPSEESLNPNQINDGSYEQVAKKKFDQLYEERKGTLLPLGWTIEEYETLSEEEREYVFAQKIKEGDYFINKSIESGETTKGDVSDIEWKTFIDDGLVSSATLEKIAFLVATRNEQNPLSARQQAILNEKSGEINEKIREINQKINQILDEIWHTVVFKENGQIEIIIPKEYEEFASKYESLFVAEINRRKKEEYDQTAKGVSPGAKEFLKEQNFIEQKRAELEAVYEDLSKEELAGALKYRNLPSGGDKQKLIDRLVEDDIQKMLEARKKNQNPTENESNSSEGGVNADKNIADAPKESEKVNLPENLSVSPEVDQKLRGLGINSLESMYALSPEFFSLSKEKQIYLISKLEQKIYLDADMASKDQNEKEIGKMGWLKKIGASFGKDGRQVRLRDKIIEKIKNEGLDNYADDISVLSKYLAGAPELKYIKNEKGKLVPRFEYLETGNSESKNIETAKAFFNTAASHLGEIPYEWSLKTATSAQRDAYQKALSSYESAKNALTKTMFDNIEKQYLGVNKSGAEEGLASKYKEAQTDVMLMIRKADAGVNFGRYITQNPEMEKMTSSFLQKTFGTDLDNWGRGAAYAVAGFGTKWLGRTFAATGVGIVVAGAVGGFMADRKKRLEFDAKELRKRYGKDVEDLGVKKSVNSENVHERLEKLVNQFEKSTDEKSKSRILETIKTRLFVTDEMMRDGRINFGKPKDQVKNQFKLSDLMSRASVLVEMNGGFNEEKSKEEEVFDRFKQFIKDDKAQSERDKARALAALKGAGVAALGFGIGAGLRYAHEVGFFESALEKLKDAKDTAGGIVWDWWKGDGDMPQKTPDDTEIAPAPSPLPAPEPAPEITEYEVFESMEVGKRGVIGGIQDLQRLLSAKFAGGEMPPQYAEFLQQDAHDIAREWGAYRPGEENESAKVFKGAKFEIGKNGEVRFVDHEGSTQKVFAPQVGAMQNFEGDFFDTNRSGVRSSVFEASQMNQSGNETFDQIAQEKIDQGFERSRSGFGEVFSRKEPIVTEKNPFWDNPPQKEYGEPVSVGRYGDIRGSYKFLEGPNGQIESVDTRKLISDDVIKFRQNPRNFMVEDLTKTDLLAKTDSFAVKTLFDNRGDIEELLKLRHLQDAPNIDLAGDQSEFLAQQIDSLEEKVSKATGGAFDAKAPERVASVPESAPRSMPERITRFNTDPENVPASKDVGVSEPEAPIRKDVPSFVTGADGQKTLSTSYLAFLNYDDEPKLRESMVQRLVNPKYHSQLAVSSDFDRLARIQEQLDYSQPLSASEETDAMKRYVESQKDLISRRLGAKDVFDVSASEAAPVRGVLNGVEYITSPTKINFESDMVAKLAREYVTGDSLDYSGNIMALGDDHVAIYEESSSQRVADQMIKKQYRDNYGKLGAFVDERQEYVDGKWRLIKVYKKIK